MTFHRELQKPLAALSFLAIAALALAAEPPAKQPKAKTPPRPRVLVTISKETTYITEPLRPDGYPDYIAALNRRTGEGVTRDNNAAVPFWRAIGPGGVPKDRREKYFRMLDILPPADQGGYFVDVWQYLDEHASADPAAPREAAKSPPPAEVWKKYIPTTIRPWSKEEFPLLAQWVAANEKPLDLVVEACKQPRCFDPLVAAGTNLGARIVFCHYDAHRDPGLFPFEEASIPIAKALVARAMLRLHEGKKGKAWEDLMACHRLARLAGQGPTGFAPLVAWAIDQRAQIGDRVLLEHAGASPAQIAKMRLLLADLPPLPKPAEAVDKGERLIYLDYATTAARRGFLEMLEAAGLNNGSTIIVPADLATRMMVDWDMVLRFGNLWYDRYADALGKPTRAGRAEAAEKIHKDVQELRALTEHRIKTIRSETDNLREASTRIVAAALLIVAGEPVSGFVEQQDRFAAETGLTDAAFALAAYRAEHGAYPAQLADLVPKYVAKVPNDIFNNDAELHYTRRGDGYLLYSVGPNGKDDGGKTFEEWQTEGGHGKPWDDLVVRVPAKP